MRVVGEKPLSAKQEKAIVALLSNVTIKDAAQEAGVGESTLRRWLKDSDFLLFYREQRSRFLEGAVAGLQSAVADAVEALARNLSCGDFAVEVRAAQAIIDRALKAEETYNAIARIEALEEAERRRNETSRADVSRWR